MTRRIVQLVVGLWLYGAGCALTVQAGIGLDPWTVFAQGLSVQTGVGIGWITNLVGFAVLLLWIPLRQRPGIGTVANILMVGTSMQMTLAIVPAFHGWLAQGIGFLGGVLLVAVASGLYIGAHFGPGPRDGLMTGLHGRLGWPVWACRLIVEATVLVAGWMLGGTVGLGTVLFAVLIGPLVHIALPVLDAPVTRARSATDTLGETTGTLAGRTGTLAGRTGTLGETTGTLGETTGTLAGGTGTLGEIAGGAGGVAGVAESGPRA